MKTDSQSSIAKAEDNRKPLIFRIRNQAPPLATKADYPHLLAVCWQHQSPNAQGMPSLEEAQRMAEHEDLLDAGLDGVGQAFLTVIVTENGVREGNGTLESTKKRWSLSTKDWGALIRSRFG